MLDLAANVLNDSGRIPEALRLRKDAVEAARSIAETYPARRHRLAMQYSSLAVLHAKTGEFVEASAAGDACAASMSDPEFTSSPASRFMTAQNLFVLGRLLVQGSYRREALRPYLLAIDNFRVLRSDTSRPAESKLALCLNNHAWNLCVLEEPDEALPFAEEAVDLMRSLAESAPTERGLLASYLDSLATARAMSGRTDEALTACREALDIRRELAAADPEKHQAKVASIEKLEALIRGSESGSFTER
jgi:tetratricopeptide (TPR) repeat protein